MPTKPDTKCPSGIDGLDQITAGGLPRGHTTLVYGGPGSGKTLLGLQFLARGAEMYQEPGVIVSFEETSNELTQNAAAMGCPLVHLIEQGQIYVDCIEPQWPPEQEAGAFNLEGLFFRIGAGIKAVGAKRLVIDSLESLFTRYMRRDIVRTEVFRLHRWLKDRAITAVITGESGIHSLTRYGIEEYISDGIIHLDHPVINHIATRRIRVVKLRGSDHGTNEYPFTISNNGIVVLPVTSLTLDYPVSDERVSSGIPRLDTMLDGAGYYRGSTVLISGTSGTGKTSLAIAFALAGCQRGERVLYVAFEEPPAQIVRNVRSIGMDLEQALQTGHLRIHAQRASSFGLETHLAQILDSVERYQPHALVIDPISNLASIAPEREVKAALTRLIDHLKHLMITTVFTDLSRHGDAPQTTDSELSSLMDSWIVVRSIEQDGERNRGLSILKSRGMRHSNQIREFRISSQGLDLMDVYTGSGGVLTGTARVALEAREAAERVERERKLEQLRIDLADRQVRFERQNEALEREFEQDLRSLQQHIEELESTNDELVSTNRLLAQMRGKDRG